ncbi:hypothetical protein LINGRAHAP2_LOCUS19734 [Linum grandiflorum]
MVDFLIQARPWGLIFMILLFGKVFGTFLFPPNSNSSCGKFLRGVFLSGQFLMLGFPLLIRFAQYVPNILKLWSISS